MESHISKTLTEKITKVVIILILATLFMLPLFDYSLYFINNISVEFGFYQLIRFYESYEADGVQITKDDWDLAFQKYKDYHSDDSFPIFKLKVPEQTTWEDDDLDDFRTDEYAAFAVAEHDAEVFYNKKWLVKVEAIINISRTFMVCCLLGGASYYFNKDS